MNCLDLILRCLQVLFFSHCCFSQIEFAGLPNEPLATSYYYRYSSVSDPSTSSLEGLPRELMWRILDQVTECLREIRAVRFSHYFFLQNALKIIFQKQLLRLLAKETTALNEQLSSEISREGIICEN